MGGKFESFRQVEEEERLRREITAREEDTAEKISDDFGDAMSTVRTLEHSIVQEVDEQSKDRIELLADTGTDTFETQAEKTEDVRQGEIDMAQEMGEAKEQHRAEADKLGENAQRLDTEPIADAECEVADVQRESAERFADHEESIDQSVEKSQERIDQLERDVQKEARNLPF